MGWNTPTDGLVVDPVQALMGIVTFLLFEHLGCAVVAVRVPPLNAGLRAWLKYASSFWYVVFPAAVSIFFHEYPAEDLFEKYDWVFVPAFGASSIACAYMDRKKIEGRRIYVAPAYAIILAGAVAGVNQIPFNPWFLTLFMHTPIFILYCLYSIPRALEPGPKFVPIVMPPDA